MKKIFYILFIYLSNAALWSQWVNIGTLSGTGANYPTVSAVDDNVVWIAGGSAGTPVIYRSTNGGTNFVSVPVPPCFDITCLWGISANECFAGDGGSSGAAGGNAKLFRTTNAGVNWILINQTGGSSGFFLDVVFSRVNTTDGAAISNAPNGSGQQFYLLKTTDTGNNWTVENPPAVSGAQGVWHSGIIYSAEAYGFSLSGGILPRIYGTTDFGTSWQVLPILLTGNPVASFAFSTVNQIALVGTSTVVARTTDQGASWQVVNSGGALCIKWITGTNTSYFMSSGIIKKSTDEGVTWNTMTIAGVTGLKHFDFALAGGNIYGYAITSTGMVIKLTDNLTGIHRIDENIPKQFSLEQNYPNPFNPSTVISFQLAVNSFTSLKIYDELGREVETLVNDELKPGKYEVSFDGTNLSTGTYFYRLTTGEFVDTKKMIFVK